MNKPDWKDAPDWAQYLAQDSDGSWFWYERAPRARLASWVDGGRTAPAQVSAWEKTLETRPSGTQPVPEWMTAALRGAERATRPETPQYPFTAAQFAALFDMIRAAAATARPMDPATAKGLVQRALLVLTGE